MEFQEPARREVELGGGGGKMARKTGCECRSGGGATGVSQAPGGALACLVVLSIDPHA